MSNFKAPDKQALNEVSIESLEAMLAEEVEEMTLFDCTFNWSCKENGN